ncbi:MAG: hypothetical protein ACO1OO_11115 [Flavisolibacter sp.]
MRIRLLIATLSVCLLLLTSSCNVEKNTVLYHKYYQSASDWNIVAWNLRDTTGERFLLRETVDKKGRVIMLEFLENDSLSGSLCYLANKIKFDYSKNAIVETLFLGDSLMYATDCEMHYKTIYHLDRENYLTTSEQFARYDLENLGGSTLEQWKQWVPPHIIIDTTNNPLRIDYYTYSFAKMNGIYPVSRNFKLSDDYPDGEEPERQSIFNGLQKLKKNNR